MVAVPSTAELLERETELEIIRAAVDSAAGGRGGVLLVEGEAGIGKTALLARVAARAEARGMRVLRARGSDLERELGFGIVRQLFEPALVAVPAAERRRRLRGPAAAAAGAVGLVPAAADAASAADDFTIFHGLYWLCANLVAENGLHLAIDDAHVADAPSVRWLTYLARRIADLPVVVAIAARAARREELGFMTAEPSTTVIRPEPLSDAAIAAMTRAQLGQQPDDEFVRALRTATAGNPFLARELIGAAAAEGRRPTREEASRLAQVTLEPIARRLLARLAPLSDPARAVAEAVAVLGDRVPLRHAAAVTALPPADVAAAADELAEHEFLVPGRPLEFRHPIVRDAIYGGIPAGRRAAAHERAARALASEGESRERVAVHLLQTDSTGDGWTVRLLRQAAAEAPPEAAVRYLRRALAEPPDAASRPEVLVELGEAEAIAFEPLETAIAHLECGLALDAAPDVSARGSLALAAALLDASRPERALEVIDDALARVGRHDHELLLRCEAMKLTTEDLLGRPPDRARFNRLRELADRGATAGERVLLANLAYDVLASGGVASEARALAERALAGDALLEERLYFDHHVATWALEFADDLASAQSHASRAVEEARRRGSSGELAFALTVRGVIENKRGALREAEADVRTALQVASDHGLEPEVVPFTYALLIDVLTERAAYGEAEEAVARCGFSLDDPPSPVRAYYFHARGRLNAALDRPDAALADLRAAGAMMAAQSIDHPAYYPWRSAAADILAVRGRPDEASALAADELRLARAWQAARPLGIALRTTGLLQRGGEAIELLRESVAVLRESPAELERARSLSELGSALRRQNRRRDAREPLLEALDLAHRCDAPSLEAHVREELRVLGARPRRAALSGVEALTASELRVATLAADGLTNREIAQALVVSMPTVEKHLGSVYRKLDVSSRAALPDVLGASA